MTTRALSQPFTTAPRTGSGAGRSCRCGSAGSGVRGVVIGLDEEAPAGVAVAPVERVVDEVPAPLVDLALWLADYYGSTPGRALALVAPKARRAASGRSRPSGSRSRARPAGRAERRAGGRARADRRRARRGRRRASAPGGADRLRQDRGLPPGLRGRARRGLGRSCSCRRSRSRRRPSAASARGSATPSRSCTRRSPTPERRDERERIARGEARVVVGARSAVFAPVEPLGLICVDEEHDPAYKQESDPRYDARTVAAKRAALEGAVAIYGSATPRPESWARLERISLGDAARRADAARPARRPAPRVGYPLSAPLLGALGATRSDGGKAILLLNRRGVAPALHCRACGMTPRCVNCDVALMLHTDEALRCHHCGQAEAVAADCPACGSAELARIGAGRSGSSASSRRAPGARAVPARRGRLAPAGSVADVAARFPPPTAQCCSARRWSRRATTSPGSRSPP